MERGDVALVAQLLVVMKEAVNKLEKAFLKKDTEEILKAKKEILKLQQQIDNLT